MKRVLSTLAVLAVPWVLAAQDAPPRAETVRSPDQMLDEASKNNWSIVLMDQPGRKIVFTFGQLGRQVVDLYWARERGASLGETQERLNQMYGEDGSDAGGANAAVGFGSAGPAGSRADWSARAYSDLAHAAGELNKGQFQKAENDVTLVQSESGKLPGKERRDYQAAADALRRMNGVLASGEALRRLVRAAPRGDFAERVSLEKAQRFYARGMGLETESFLDADGAIWDAYRQPLEPPSRGQGSLAAALRDLDAAEKMVQTRFKRSEYVNAMQQVWRESAGLSRADRAALAGRLGRLAAVWNASAADGLAFAWYAAASGRPELEQQRAALIAQAQWKGEQGGRAAAFARALLQ